jgi:hypothetical protein
MSPKNENGAKYIPNEVEKVKPRGEAVDVGSEPEFHRVFKGNVLLAIEALKPKLINAGINRVVFGLTYAELLEQQEKLEQTIDKLNSQYDAMGYVVRLEQKTPFIVDSSRLYDDRSIRQSLGYNLNEQANIVHFIKPEKAFTVNVDPLVGNQWFGPGHGKVPSSADMATQITDRLGEFLKGPKRAKKS